MGNLALRFEFLGLVVGFLQFSFRDLVFVVWLFRFGSVLWFSIWVLWPGSLALVIGFFD